VIRIQRPRDLGTRPDSVQHLPGNMTQVNY
jgi:hypothetical protein